MNIYYDFQAFSNQKFGGISRYFSNLALVINSQGEHNAQVGLKYSRNSHVSDISSGDEILSGSFRGMNRITEKFLIRMNFKLSRKILSMNAFDIFHPTYYDDYFLKLIKKPFVITVHDMIHEKFSHYFGKDKTAYKKRLLCDRANHIITVSHTTKKDIIEILKIPEKKISVTYLAASLIDSPVYTWPVVPERFVLFVGNRWGYKNFSTFLLAIAPIMKKDQSLFVVCTGDSFSQNELKAIDASGLTNRFISYFAGEREMKSLYQRALMFVYPSIYEGFGLPILEAFSAGCPIILHRAGSLPEIGGDAAIYFEKNSTSELTSCIEEMARNENLRNALIQAGKSRIREFSWEKTAHDTINIYKRIA